MPKHHSLINPNLELATAQHATNEITDNNSHSRHPQCAITSEGGHTTDTTSFTSEGAHWQEKERVRLTFGGDRLDYSGNIATSTSDITTFKILINSTLSTEDAAMMTMDSKNYYLGIPLPRFEYTKNLLSRFPEEIIQKNNLNALSVDGWVYIEIRKGMYGLKQAGLLANQLLQTRLAPFGYYPARHTPGLWLHKTRPISFTLVVDDFAVK
jgi:hypothetical protein